MEVGFPKLQRSPEEVLSARRQQFEAEYPNKAGVDLLRARFSCRSFLEDPLADTTIEQILTLADRSPSWCNTQPWSVTVLQGDLLKALTAELLSAASSSEPAPEVPHPQQYQGQHLQRRRQSGFALYESVGIERSDRDRRSQQVLKNFEFFDAPCALVVTVPKYLGQYALVDLGAYLSYLQLTAQSYGVATILQAAISLYPEAVRKVVSLPTDEALVCGVSMGYPDLDAPINSFETERAQEGTWQYAQP